jgi:hypothetical protein
MDDRRDSCNPHWPKPALDVVVCLSLVVFVAGALLWFLRVHGDASLAISVPAPASITGTVTLDGKPLADADVLFTQTDTKGELRAAGTTDQNGRYRLRHSIDGVWIDGALPGKYDVRFSRIIRSDGTRWRPSGGHLCLLAIRESVPMEYALKSAFTVEVSNGKNNGFDFALRNRPR